MIIQLRGTSGSGKTTVVRDVVEELGGFDSFEKVYSKELKSKSPICYVSESYSLAIIGSYTNLCGGVDRVQAMGGYDLFQKVVGDCLEYRIIMEGLLLSEDVKQSTAITGFKKRARVIFLETEVETCIARVNKRRELHNRSRPLNTQILSNRIKTIQRARTRLENLGISCFDSSSIEAPRLILSWLGYTLTAKGTKDGPRKHV